MQGVSWWMTLNIPSEHLKYRHSWSIRLTDPLPDILGSGVFLGAGKPSISDVSYYTRLQCFNERERIADIGVIA